MKSQLKPDLLEELRKWLPKVRALEKSHGSFGPSGFNETWAREARIMALYHGITSNEWLAHVRAIDA